MDYMKRMNTSGAASKVLSFGLFFLNGVMVGFRFLQWWQTSRNTGEVAGSLMEESLPTPPPPKPPVPHPTFVSAEQEAGRSGEVTPGICPVCHNKVVNPAVNIVSGIVYCYPCLHQHLQQEGYCPVTHQHATVQHIRRLYET